MPWKPPRPCRYCGCPSVTRHTSRYCDVHKHYRRKPDTRPSSAKRGYGTEWRDTRATYLQYHITCEICHVQKTTDVHHIDGNPQNNKMSNLKALCHKCHSSITGKTVGGFV